MIRVPWWAYCESFEKRNYGVDTTLQGESGHCRAWGLLGRQHFHWWVWHQALGTQCSRKAVSGLGSLLRERRPRPMRTGQPARLAMVLPG